MRYAVIFALLVLSARSPAQTPPTPEPATAPKAAGLAFARSHEKAAMEATATKRLLLWVIMKDGEIGCSRMLQTVYRDPDVQARLAASFIMLPCSTYDHGSLAPAEGVEPVWCSQFAHTLCSEHQAIEREMRKRYEESVNVVAPQHIITDAEGKILARHRYELKKPEFLAFLESVVPGTAAAPKTDAQGLPLPDRASAGSRGAALLEQVLKGTEEERCKAAQTLCTLADKPAIAEMVTAIEKGRVEPAGLKQKVVRACGSADCSAAAVEFTRLFSSKETLLRNGVVVTIEEMANTAAVPALLTLWKTEKDPEIRKDILRALGPCGAGSDEARTLLMKEARSTTELLRVAACIGLGHHTTGNADVRKLLLSRYEAADAKGQQRLAVIYAWSLSRNAEVLPDIDAALARESNGELKDLLNAVKRALGGTVEAQPPRGRGRFGEWAVWRALGTLLDKDRIERNAVKALRERRGPGG